MGQISWLYSNAVEGIICLLLNPTAHRFHTNPSQNNLFKLSFNKGSSKKMDGNWNRYNLKSTRRIYTFGIIKCSEKFKVLDLP